MIGPNQNMVLFGSNTANPLSILPGKMKFWINSTSASVTGTVDGAITAVKDLSPNNLIINSTVPNQPILALGAPDATASRNTFKNGSNAAIYFQLIGANRFNAPTGATYTTGLSIFATINFTSGTLTNSFASGFPTYTLCSSTGSYFFTLGFNIQNAGDAVFTNYNYVSGIYDILVTSTGGLNDGNAHTIAMTQNNATGELKLYVDGVFQSSLIQNGNTSYLSSWTVDTIGSADTSGTYEFAGGMLAEIFSWDGILTAKNVLDLHNRSNLLWANIPIKGTAPTIINPPTIFGANCIRSYEDTASGAVWTDASGNGNTSSIGADPTLTTLSSGKVAYSFSGAQCLVMSASHIAAPSFMTAWCIFNSSTAQTTTYLQGAAYSTYGWALGIGTGFSAAPSDIAGAPNFVIRSSFTKAAGAAITLLDGKNHSVIGVYDGTNVTLYIDGQIYSSYYAGLTGAISDDASALPSIGAKCSTTPTAGSFFTGLISSVGYANVAANTTQLQQLNNWLNSRK